MRTNEKKGFSEFLGEVVTSTLIIFSNDCHQMEMAISNTHLQVMTCFGLDLINAGTDTLKSILNEVENECPPQIILVNHFPSKIHQILLNDFNKEARWNKQAERVRRNYLKLKKKSVQLISDRDFALAHLKQQVIFLSVYLKNTLRKNFEPLLIKGLLLDNQGKIFETENIFYQFHQN